MTDRADRIAGVIGGMGPDATVEFMRRIVRSTPSSDDADHVHMLVDNDPGVPSRIKHLIDECGDSPGPYLADMGRRLEVAGADFLAMPCNTAHHYYQEIVDAVSIPVLNMIEISISHLMSTKRQIQRVGILASPAVYRTRAMEPGLAAKGIESIHPSEAKQHEVLEVIKAVKRQGPEAAQRRNCEAAIREMQHNGAQAIMIACSELSILDFGETVGIPKVDTLQALAEAVVEHAKGSNVAPPAPPGSS